VDRRQKRTREAIFLAFSDLLSKKDFSKITVGEIIEKANVGRATFYAHFETKDFLLKELCSELFCHLFDMETEDGKNHKHIFECDAPSSVILHLLQHLKKNDNNILDLLACENNQLFIKYFKENLNELFIKERHVFGDMAVGNVPFDFWINYVSSTLVETVRWWAAGGMKESPQTIFEYFYAIVSKS
jgi:AcrR family transcriptional regulator